MGGNARVDLMERLRHRPDHVWSSLKKRNAQHWQRSRSIERKYGRNGDFDCIGKRILLFFHALYIFAQLHVSEVCSVKWPTIFCNVRRDTNEVYSAMEFVTDSTRQCLEERAFKPLKDGQLDGFLEIKALSLSCQKDELDRRERRVWRERELHSSLSFLTVFQGTCLIC